VTPSLVFLMALAGPAATGEPPAELLPAPTPLEPPVIVVVPPAFLRPNPLDVWQVLAPDRRGSWKPRVAVGPDGLTNLVTGEPYPFLPVQPRDLRPWVEGTPYR
jgi:hypothetical protein